MSAAPYLGEFLDNQEVRCRCNVGVTCDLCKRECERVTAEDEALEASYKYALDVICLLDQLRWSCNNDKALRALEHAKYCVSMVHNLPIDPKEG